ncbi:hypothetical protein L7F22_026615 [Adiantum nelumboides]|nr:hypothetical protein [Adiantum nelumboides]
MEDVAPRRRRAQRSPTPTKRKRSPHSPHRRESKREEKNSKKKKERKRSPSSPSSSPSSSSDEGSGYSSQERQRRGHRRSYAAWKRSSKLKKFKEGGKNISFLTYDGTFGATDKVLAFIQQFDAAFGDEGFTESSKLRHVAMHFQKSARQWWASLRANGEAPKTWKALRASIMKQFLASDAKDKVLTEWRSLKLSPYESIHKYVDKFWNLHLKATVYKKIDFEEQKQQFCAGLPEDMNEYVNSQRPRSILAVIHHTMVAARINFQQGAKRNLKPMEVKEKQEYKGKNFSQNSSKGNSNNNKAKEKGVFKGKTRLTPEELGRYRKENKCFKCGEQGHSYRSCPQRNPRNEQPRVVSPKEKRRTPKRRRRERGHPLLPPHHPLPLRMKVVDILLKKDKGEDTEGHMLLGKDKVLAFIQQFDAAFGDEGFTESSNLRHVAMHFQKSARQWWASLRANGEAPKTWKALRASIMKQFLASDAKDKVLTEWRSLKLSPYESTHKYVDKFWNLHLKATVYKKIDFEEQKQQFCAGLPEDMNEYVNSQRPRSILAVIHHTMVAARINFQQGAKRNLKPMEVKEKQEYKGKNFSQNSSKGNSNNNKAKEKGVFKGKTRLTPEELERYRKENNSQL